MSLVDLLERDQLFLVLSDRVVGEPQPKLPYFHRLIIETETNKERTKPPPWGPGRLSSCSLVGRQLGLPTRLFPPAAPDEPWTLPSPAAPREHRPSANRADSATPRCRPAKSAGSPSSPTNPTPARVAVAPPPARSSTPCCPASARTANASNNPSLSVHPKGVARIWFRGGTHFGGGGADPLFFASDPKSQGSPLMYFWLPPDFGGGRPPPPAPPPPPPPLATPLVHPSTGEGSTKGIKSGGLDIFSASLATLVYRRM